MRNRSFYNRFIQGVHPYNLCIVLECIVVINMLINDLVASIW